MLIWDIDSAYSDFDDEIRRAELEVREWKIVTESDGYAFGEIVRSVVKYDDDTEVIEWRAEVWKEDK